MTYLDVLSAIERLPKFREIACPLCETKQQHFVLNIHGLCKQCNKKYRLRGEAAIGTEIEDVLDAVFEWMGEGDHLEECCQHQQRLWAEAKRQRNLEKENDKN